MLKQVMSTLLAVSVFCVCTTAMAQSMGPSKGMQTPAAERGVIIISGKVTKVDGNNLVVRDSNGRETVVQGHPGVKVGDAVSIRNGRVEMSR